MTLELFLDHCFVGIDAAAFAEYAVLGTLLAGTEVRTTTASDVTWSGVYLRAASGVYFEFLKRADTLTHAGLGVAVSGLGYESNVAAHLRRAHPQIAWQVREMRLQNAAPWFSAIEAPDQDARIWTWAMEFFGEKRSERQARIGQEDTPIAHLRSLELRAPTRLCAEFPARHAWLPGERRVTAECYELRVPCYRADDFVITITPDNTVQLPEVTALTARLKPQRTVPSYDGQHFRMHAHGEELQFAFQKKCQPTFGPK